MSRKLRVLAIGHSYVVSLNRALLREVAEDKDFEVTVVAPELFLSELGLLHCEPEPEGSPLKVIPARIHWGKWVYTFGYDSKVLNRLMEEGHFDVVYAWEEPYIYAGYQIARAVARLAPQAAYCFRTAQSLPKRYRPPFSYFERKCLERIDGWVAGAHLVYENSVARGYPAEKGKTLTLAVDTSAFVPLPEAERQLIRDETGLRVPVLGYIGRLTPEKGIDVMLRAIEMLEADRQWSLLVLGSGPSEVSIKQWAREHDWSDRVVVRLVRHDEVPRYLASMDVLLAPSLTTRRWREQFGRMVIEAFACGVPVISSDSGELPYVIEDAGWIVPEGDATALSHTIEAALDDPARRAEIARIAREQVKRYSTLTLARAFRDYYRKLSEQKRKTSSAA